MTINHTRKFKYVLLFLLICCIFLQFSGCADMQQQKTVTSFKIPNEARQCIECHEKKKISKIALRDWQFSTHAEQNVTCIDCHIPIIAISDVDTNITHCDNKSVRRSVSPKNCEACHPEKISQFASGKHSKAWKVIKNLQNVPGMTNAFDIEKDCSQCHRIGRDEGKCDSCHTRHKFSAAEARRPEACRTCHMGSDHPQWETYAASKHGSIYSIEGHEWFWEKSISEWYTKPLIDSTVIPRAPVCVTCHMPDGNHAINASWGFRGMRLSEKDTDWKKSRDLFFNGLGFYDDKGDVSEDLKAIISGTDEQFSKEAWFETRNKMVKICSQCHTSSFSNDILNEADNTIKECDKLLVKAITVINGLYDDGIIKKTKRFFPHADLVKYDNFQNPIEELLYKMYAQHRMKTYMGTFHLNPSSQHSGGWGEMKKRLNEIKVIADNLRKASGEK